MLSGRFRNFATLVEGGGVDLDAYNQTGVTPLIFAINHSNKISSQALIRTLLQYGASINKPDNNGRPPLHHAVTQHNVSITKLLLEYKKLNKLGTDNKGRTALHIAVILADFQMVKILINHMALYCIESDVKDQLGMTPLLYACKSGRLDIARYLNRVGRHSPMNRDNESARNGLQWLETVLFIPYEINDPFNCPHHELSKIQPKPYDYVCDDCKENLVRYNWHDVILKGMQPVSKRYRPHSSPLTKSSQSARLDTRLDVRSMTPTDFWSKHSEPAFFSEFTGRESPKSYLYKRCVSINEKAQRVPSCKDILPYMFALKAKSVGVLPAAVPPPEEEKTPSEMEAELDELNESQSKPSILQRQLSTAMAMEQAASALMKGKRKSASESKASHKMENVTNAITATHRFQKIGGAARRRKSIVSTVS